MTDSIQEEDGILFNVVRADVSSYDPYDIIDFVKGGFCKVVLTIDEITIRTYYFRNGVETSKEKIIQDERLKQLRR